MPKRIPPPGAHSQPTLPHDHDREQAQPYATEVEDYSHGVAPPPAEQRGRGGANPRTTKGRMKKVTRGAPVCALSLAP
jgi:hypothetical protein